MTVVFASLSAVTAPFASLSAVTAPFPSFDDVTAPSAIDVVVTALFASVGFGYVPASAPPAAPPGVVPVIATCEADVTRPLASTLMIAVCCCPPYTPGTAPVGVSFALVTCASPIFDVETAPSASFGVVT